jgi:hypothetical protein
VGAGRQIGEGSGFDIVVREEAETAWLLELSGGFATAHPSRGAGVPINEILRAFDLIAILVMRHSKFDFANTPVFLPLILLWMQATAQLLIGLYANGVWAIRDAAV